jgi:hypothetical protein
MEDMQARSAKTAARPPKSGKALTGKPDDPEQSKAFIEKAREIGADEKRSAADKLMGRLAKMKPEPRKPTTAK